MPQAPPTAVDDVDAAPTRPRGRIRRRLVSHDGPSRRVSGLPPHGHRRSVGVMFRARPDQTP
ncbi:hypothetical protein FTX61_07865 [Nitriliruptoraceae bacterium ZYF776]|nr:hypothetical protein [Profundirhabdus halotolerans]